MPGRVYEGDLVVPAGTTAAAPATAALPIDQGTLVKVTLVVPPGHAGLTGFQLRLAGTAIVPYAGAAWIVANAYTDSWELDQDVVPGNITLAGYNTDVYPHTFYVRALLAQRQAPSALLAATPSAGAAGLDLTALQVYPGAEGTPEGTGAASPLAGAGACYDADGNLVDCSDPAAVSGPVGSSALAAGPYPTGVVTGPAAPSGPCYDIAGNVVDCGDPAAVSGPVAAAGGPSGVITPLQLPAITVVSAAAAGSGAAPAPAPRPSRPVVTRAGGPFRQAATGTESLNHWAAARHLSAEHVVAVTRTAHLLTAGQLAAFNAYVRAGLGRRMPRGLIFYAPGR